MSAIADPRTVEALRLAAAVALLPEEHRLRVAPLLDDVLDGIARRKRMLLMVQDAIGDLRMDLKYFQFDLEATRRERDYYRGKAQGQPPSAS